MSGIFSAPKLPATPDPAATIDAQAKASQINQITPNGTQTYGTTDANGNFVANPGNTTLQVENSPFVNELNAGGQDISLALLDSLKAGGAGNLPGVRTASQIESGLGPLTQDFSGDAQQAQTANFNANLALLQPQMDRERRQTEQRLADQGLPIGSEAYKDELNRLESSQGQQLQQLSQSSVSAGNDRSNQLAQLLMGQQAQQFNTQSGLQNQENQARASQFGELGALLGFATPYTQFNTTPINAAGIINDNYSNQLTAAGIKQKAQSANIGALAGLLGQGASAAGGTAGLAALSDINLKENIKFMGLESGQKIYEFNYKKTPGDRYIGVMAQEVQKTHPEAVIQTEEGLAVIYDRIGVQFRRIS